MSFATSHPIRPPYRSTQRRSNMLFHWNGRFLTVDAITEQAGVYTATTTGSATDTGGSAYTAVHSQPRWHENSDLRRPALRMTSRDQLYWSLGALAPRAMTVHVLFVEQGTVATASAKLFHLGHQTTEATDARFYVDSDGSNYRVAHDNGSTVVSATLAAAPGQDDGVEILATLNADGSVDIAQSINGATATTASDATTATLQSSWAGPYLHLNGVGSGNQGANDFLSVKLGAGARSLAQMRVTF